LGNLKASGEVMEREKEVRMGLRVNNKLVDRTARDNL